MLQPIIILEVDYSVSYHFDYFCGSCSGLCAWRLFTIVYHSVLPHANYINITVLMLTLEPINRAATRETCSSSFCISHDSLVYFRGNPPIQRFRRFWSCLFFPPHLLCSTIINMFFFVGTIQNADSGSNTAPTSCSPLDWTLTCVYHRLYLGFYNTTRRKLNCATVCFSNRCSPNCATYLH